MRPGMPQIPQTKTYTACSFSPQLVYRSLWFGGSRAKHRLREQDTDNRRGQPFARNSKGVRGRPFGGEHQDDKHADAPRPRPRRLFVPHGQLPAPSQRARSTKSSHGSTVREHHPPSSSLGVRPYSSNPSREERLRPCRHPPCVSGYLRGQLIPFRIIKRHRGTRRRNASVGPGSH